MGNKITGKIWKYILYYIFLVIISFGILLALCWWLYTISVINTWGFVDWTFQTGLWIFLGWLSLTIVWAILYNYYK